MAKQYNFMTKAEYSIYAYGILIKPHCGTVETTWKMPSKYQELAEKWIYAHFGNASHPTIDIDVMGNVVFKRNIDYSNMFENITFLANLEKYNQVIAARDEAINAACYQLLRSKESFQDMIRGMFYTERFVNNAPSIP